MLIIQVFASEKMVLSLLAMYGHLTLWFLLQTSVILHIVHILLKLTCAANPFCVIRLKWTDALRTHLRSNHQTTFGDGLSHMWPHSFSSGNNAAPHATKDGSFASESVQRNDSLTQMKWPDSMLYFSLALSTFSTCQFNVKVNTHITHCCVVWKYT